MTVKKMLIIIAAFVVVSLLSMAFDYTLSKLYPRWFDDDGMAHHTGIMAAMLLWRYALYLLAGYVTRSPVMIGLVFVLGAALGFARNWDGATMWFHHANVALALPFAFLGGWLARRRMINSQ